MKEVMGDDGGSLFTQLVEVGLRKVAPRSFGKQTRVIGTHSRDGCVTFCAATPAVEALRPKLAVERAILDRLTDVLAGDGIAAREVCDGARDF